MQSMQKNAGFASFVEGEVRISMSRRIRKLLKIIEGRFLYPIRESLNWTASGRDEN